MASIRLALAPLKIILILYMDACMSGNMRTTATGDGKKVACRTNQIMGTCLLVKVGFI